MDIIITMEEGTIGIMDMVDMMIIEDHTVVAVEGMIMDLLPTHLIDTKMIVATIAVMDGTMMRGDITTITTTIEVIVAADDEDHHLLDYPSQKFHLHSLAQIAN